ncbi:MAG: hypothetical protein H6Q91_522 [Deltaproteobacteria bacterium]|nr:hypothetical protein [Deltaproteobacteria bacterium]
MSAASRRRGCRVVLLTVALAVSQAGRASAWIPEPESAWSLVAQSNGAASRTRALAIDIALVGADGAVVATGTARLEPNGRARLGVTFADGTVEMHERTPIDYQATRAGTRVEKPLRLIPPLVLLQAGSAQAVADALRTLGGDPKLVDLGMEGAHDCWVLGGRDMGAFDANTRVSLWVDQESQQPVRIDDGSGTQYRFGTPKKGEDIRFPAWIDVRAATGPSWRIDVRSVRPAP